MTLIQLRGGPAATWATANPVLASREMGVETDTLKFKIGNGSTPWNSLAYQATGNVVGPVSAAVNQLSQFTDSTGKVVKPVTVSGLLKLATGVPAAAAEGTDFYGPAGTDIAVTDGGSGRSSAGTAYGILAAGTTPTGAHQTIAPGPAGQYLRSGGNAALGGFAAPATAELSDGGSLPISLPWSGTAWPARTTTTRTAFFIGGTAPDNAPTDANLHNNDLWFPAAPAGSVYIRTNGAWTSTAQSLTPPVTPPPPNTQVERPFFMMEEILHDGGGEAFNHKADFFLQSASFRGPSTPAEANFWSQNHLTVNYYQFAQDLIMPVVLTDIVHPGFKDDPNYRTSVTNLTAQYGAEVYLHAFVEWDQDPGNNYWATNRFLEAGSSSVPNHPTTGMSRQTIYDQFTHFYLANNHGGNLNHHQLGQILNVSAATRGYKVACVNVYAQNVFYSAEWGVDLIFLERNNDDIEGLIGSLPMIRGAAQQYSKRWGIDVSQWRSYFGGGVTAYSGSTLTGGWTNSTYRRTFYLSYFGGADQIFLEGVSLTDGGTVNYNGRLYIPLVTEYRNFFNFAITRHPQRGVPHVPIAVMEDHISGWNPRFGQFRQARGVWYGQITANSGENMLHNLWNWIYPNYATWGSSTTAAEPWGSGRWGEQFNMITDRIGAPAMQDYEAIILSTNSVMDSTMQTKLDTYVRAGGTVIINAKQLSGTAHEAFTGVHLVGSASFGGGNLTWDIAPTEVIVEPAFNYSTCTLLTATTIAHTGTNTPQVTRNIVGSGQVWVVMPDWMSNPANSALLGIGSKIIDYHISQNVVAWITGVNHIDIDYCITTQAGLNKTTIVVCIANNSPSNTSWTGTINFDGALTPVREWVTDTTPASSVAGGVTSVTAAVAPGDVRVYAVG